MQSKQRPRCSSPLLYKSEERQPYHSSFFISAGYYMRHPTKASGCLDWSTLSLPTGHRDMRSKRETTVHVQLKHQKAQAALPTFAEMGEARGHISRWVGQPGSLADKPCSHRTAIIKVR